jgi:hypothetical protein
MTFFFVSTSVWTRAFTLFSSFLLPLKLRLPFMTFFLWGLRENIPTNIWGAIPPLVRSRRSKRVINSGFPPVRIWYGQSVYLKVYPCLVLEKSKTAKCLYIPQKTCCPYQFFVFFFSKTIVFVKSIRKTYENSKNP